MKIGIIGATGKLGSILVDKLIEKGETPTAIIRNKTKLTKDIPFVEKDIYSLTSEDIAPFDVVVNTYNAPLDDASQFVKSMQHVIDIFKNGQTKLVVAGGAGVLLVDDKIMLVETGNIPAEFLAIAEAEVEAYKLLANETSFDWTYMAPPAVMMFDFPAKNEHQFSGNKLGVNAVGESSTSYFDYADAMIEKIYEPENHQIVGVFS